MSDRSLGTLTIELLAKLGGFKSGMSEAERQAANSAATMEKSFAVVEGAITGLVGYFTVDAFAGWINTALEVADAAGEMAQSLAVTTNEFLKLDAMTKIYGSGNINLTAGFTALNKLIDANSAKLTDLGIATRDANGETRDAYDVFLDLADVFQQMPDNAEKAAMAADIFGARFGAKMIPVLNEGKAALTDFGDHVANVSDKLAQTQGEWEKNNFQLGQSFAQLRNTLAETVMPVVNDLAEWFIKFQPTLKPVEDEILAIAYALGSVLDFAIKSTLTAVSLLLGAFEALGKIIATVAAAMVSAAHGDFAGAWEVIKAGGRDLVVSYDQMGDQLIALWGKDEEAAKEHAKNMRDALGAPVDMTAPTVTVLGGGKPGEDPLKNISITPLEDVLAQNAQKQDEYRAEQLAGEQFLHDQKMSMWADELAADAMNADTQAETARTLAASQAKSAKEGHDAISRIVEGAAAKNKTIAKAALLYNKAMALAQIYQDTPTAAMAAAKAVAGIPMIGPALAVAASAAMYGLGGLAAAAVISGSSAGSPPSAGVGSSIGSSANVAQVAPTSAGSAVNSILDIRLIDRGQRLSVQDIADAMEQIGERMADSGGRIGKVTVVMG